MARSGPDKDIAHFDRLSGKYDASWFQRYIDRLHQKMLGEVARLAANPRSVLDVGCGTGRLLLRAAALWPSAKLIGADPAEGMLEAARRQLPAAALYLAGAEALPIADASIDAAFSSLSFHHWHDRLEGLKEISRVVCPGGCLCLADIALPLWMTKLLRLKFKSRGQVRGLMTDAGFSVLAQKTALAGLVLITIGKR